MTKQFLITSDQYISVEELEAKHFFIEKLVSLRLIGKDTTNSIIYDEDLKMHFEGSKQTNLTFEYCLEDINLELDRPLKKAKEFLRVVEHRYDWMNLKVVYQIGTVEILNKQKLLSNWERMQTRLLVDYEGVTIDDYFQRSTEFSYPQDTEWPCLSQYPALGLLFPHIPQRVYPEWSKKRAIFLSEHDPAFDEEIYFKESSDGKQYFEVKGDVKSKDQEDAKCFVNQYEGEIIKRKTDVFPERTKIKIRYQRDNYTIDWNFELKEI